MRLDDVRLEDLQIACRNVAEFLEGVGRQEFLASKMLQSAVMHEMTVLGEAANPRPTALLHLRA